MYLIHFNCAEVQLKIYWSIFDCAKVDLLQVHFSCTINILHSVTPMDVLLCFHSPCALCDLFPHVWLCHYVQVCLVIILIYIPHITSVLCFLVRSRQCVRLYACVCWLPACDELPSIVTLKHTLGLILWNVLCAQLVLLIKFNNILYSLKRYVSKCVNRFKLYLAWNVFCIINVFYIYIYMFFFFFFFFYYGTKI